MRSIALFYEYFR